MEWKVAMSALLPSLPLFFLFFPSKTLFSTFLPLPRSEDCKEKVKKIGRERAAMISPFFSFPFFLLSSSTAAKMCENEEPKRKTHAPSPPGISFFFFFLLSSPAKRCFYADLGTAGIIWAGVGPLTLPPFFPAQSPPFPPLSPLFGMLSAIKVVAFKYRAGDPSPLPPLFFLLLPYPNRS